MRHIVLALCGLASLAGAQPRPTVLALPAGARAMGLGDAYVAGRTAEVIFYNPAMLTFQPGIAASAQRLHSEAAAGSLAGVYALPGGAAGVGVQWLEFGDAARGSSLAATVALNGPTIKTLRIGLSAKYVREQMDTLEDRAIGMDVGIGKDFFGRSTVTLVAQNLFLPSRMGSADPPAPSRMVLGMMAFAPPLFTYWDFGATAQVAYVRHGTIVPAGGIEMNYVPLDGWAFTGRVGGRRVDEGSGASPLTFGAGVALDRVSLDYAFQSQDPIGAHRIGVRIR